MLVEHFVKKYNGDHGKEISGFSAKSMDYFLSYDWPGNVRELENVVQRLIILGEKPVISHSDLPPQFKEHAMDNAFEDLDIRPLAEVERTYILKVMETLDNNRTMTAKSLQIDRKTLYTDFVHTNYSTDPDYIAEHRLSSIVQKFPNSCNSTFTSEVSHRSFASRGIIPR